MLITSGVRNSVVGLLGRPLVDHGFVDERAVHADRRERAAQRAVDDHHAHQQQVDPVPAGERHGQRRHDRDGEQRADRRQQRREEEEDPRHGREPSADQAHRPLHEQVDVPLFCASANR